MMVSDTSIGFEAEDFSIANVGPVEERAQKQEGENRQNSFTLLVSRQHIERNTYLISILKSIFLISDKFSVSEKARGTWLLSNFLSSCRLGSIVLKLLIV